MNFTDKEVTIINKKTKFWGSGFKLGARLKEIIAANLLLGGGGKNIVGAISFKNGELVNGDTISVYDPVLLYEGNVDIYEICTKQGGVLSAPTNIKLDLTNSTVHSQASLIIDVQPEDGDTITIGEVVYTFKTIPTLPAHVEIGTNVAATRANLVSVMTTGAAAHSLVSITAFTGNQATVQAFIGGVSGNAISVSSDLADAGSGFGAGVTHLVMGEDASGGSVAQAFMDALVAHGTVGVSAIMSPAQKSNAYDLLLYTE